MGGRFETDFGRIVRELSQHEQDISHTMAGQWRTTSPPARRYGVRHERQDAGQRPDLQAHLRLRRDGGGPAAQPAPGAGPRHRSRNAAAAADRVRHRRLPAAARRLRVAGSLAPGGRRLAACAGDAGVPVAPRFPDGVAGAGVHGDAVPRTVAGGRARCRRAAAAGAAGGAVQRRGAVALGDADARFGGGVRAGVVGVPAVATSLGA